MKKESKKNIFKSIFYILISFFLCIYLFPINTNAYSVNDNSYQETININENNLVDDEEIIENPETGDHVSQWFILFFTTLPIIVGLIICIKHLKSND